MSQPLIAHKHIAEFGADEFHAYVTAMYALRIKGRAKAPNPAPGLFITRTKTGKVGIRRTKLRAFDYITNTEMADVAKQSGITQAELFVAFKERNFIVAKDRLEAEHIHTKLQELPWGYEGENMAGKKKGKAKPAPKKGAAKPMPKSYKK